MAELKSFIQLCIEGKAKPEQINDWIDKWHESLVAIPLSLHTYLGMTWEEYGQWVQDPSTLSAIIEAHKEKMNMDTPASEIRKQVKDLKVGDVVKCYHAGRDETACLEVKNIGSSPYEDDLILIGFSEAGSTLVTTVV